MNGFKPYYESLGFAVRSAKSRESVYSYFFILSYVIVPPKVLRRVFKLDKVF
jgi:hypothetical protein